jgi:myo-inositol-hexaphosphate 3-phosphohydrolase
MATNTHVVDVEIVMNVFSGNFGAKVKAVYTEQNRKNPLGNVAGDSHDVTIIVTQAYSNAMQSEMQSQNSDVLVYAQTGSVLSNKKCEGGTLKFDGRTMRIDSFAVATNQRTGVVAHYELGCTEI